MEEILLLIIVPLALYYIYVRTFKNSACNCGNKDCPSKDLNNDQKKYY